MLSLYAEGGGGGDFIEPLGGSLSLARTAGTLKNAD